TMLYQMLRRGNRFPPVSGVARRGRREWGGPPGPPRGPGAPPEDHRGPRSGERPAEEWGGPGGPREWGDERGRHGSHDGPPGERPGWGGGRWQRRWRGGWGGWGGWQGPRGGRG